MTTINGYTLHPDIQLSEDVNQPGLRQSVIPVLGGVKVQGLAMVVGKQYVLSADLRGDKLYGYFTRADAEYMASLRDSAAVVQLVHSARTLSRVIILATGINLEVVSVNETVEQESTELMHGTITIMVV